MRVNEFDPQKDIPDLTGKVIFITGGTAGIGSETVLALAKHKPAHVYFSGRNEKSANDLVEEVKSAVPDAAVTFIECDLASLASVQAAAERFKGLSSRLDLLILNAGILGMPPSLTKDGYELQFGTNHLGHALLIKLLIPTLIQTSEQPGADVRIVSVASQAYFLSPKGGIQFDKLRSTQDLAFFGPWLRYGQSKLANILYARQLSVHYPQILTVSIHPGVVKTQIVGHMSLPNRLLPYLNHSFSMLTPTEGAYCQLWAATTDRKNVVPGEYYEPVGLADKGMKAAKDDKLAEELWKWTEKELEKFPA